MSDRQGNNPRPSLPRQCCPHCATAYAGIHLATNVLKDVTAIIEDSLDNRVDGGLAVHLQRTVDPGMEELRDILVAFFADDPPQPRLNDLHATIRTCLDCIPTPSPAVDVKILVAPNTLAFYDSTQIGAAFGNVVRNAFRAMCAGGGTLKVSIDLPDGASKAIVSFHDTGPGLSAGRLQSLRKKCGAITQQVGLPVAQMLCERNAGTLSIESTEGQGTIVHVSLPTSEWRE